MSISIILLQHHIVFEYMSNGALKDYLVTLKLLYDVIN